MFLHHLATIYAFRAVWQMPHYPWFVRAPLTFHTFLIAFPYSKWMHAPYGAIMVIFMLGLTQKPFYDAVPYRKCLQGFVIMVPALIILGLNSCDSNDLLY